MLGEWDSMWFVPGFTIGYLLRLAIQFKSSQRPGWKVILWCIGLVELITIYALILVLCTPLFVAAIGIEKMFVGAGVSVVLGYLTVCAFARLMPNFDRGCKSRPDASLDAGCK